MLRGSRLDQDFNLKLAGCAAVLLHVCLFYVQISGETYDNPKDVLKTLNVVLKRVKEEPVSEPTLLEEKPQVTQSPEPQLKEERETADIRKEKPEIVLQTSEKKEKSISVPSLDSKEFESIINEINELSIQNNPEQLEKFNHSFEPPKTDSPAQRNSEVEFSQHLRSAGVGMIINEDGSRTCYALIQNPWDVAAQPSVLSRDCTPKKKFKLDLNAPHNG